MAGESRQNGTKRPANGQEDDDDSSEDEFPDEEVSDSETELDEEEKINMDLEAQTPVENDFHGIKQLLTRLFLMLPVDASELTDMIIAQTEIGSTIKVAPADEEEEEKEADDSEDEVYGITTMINMKQHSDKNCIKELKKSVLSKCKANAPDKLSDLQNILDTKNIGFLINERFINIPPQFAVPMHQSLRHEVDEHIAAQDNVSPFDYLLMISKTLQLTDHPDPKLGGAQKTKKAKKTTEIEYTNVEEELFHVASEISFEYSVTEATGLAVGGSWDVGSQHAKPYRTVMLVPGARWKDIVDSVEELIEGS